MSGQSRRLRRCAAAALVGAVLGVAGSANAITEWTNGAGTGNWADSGNWTLGVPNAAQGDRIARIATDVAPATISTDVPTLGELWAGDNSGPAIVNMTGGSVRVTDWFEVGRLYAASNAGSTTAAFNLSGGAVTFHNAEIGWSWMTGAGNASTDATLKISGSATMTGDGFVHVGVGWTGGSGGVGRILVQDNATFTANGGDFLIGTDGGSTGEMTVSGNATVTHTGGAVFVGANAGAVGNFTQSDNAAVTFGTTASHIAWMSIGGTGQGTYNLSGGTLDVYTNSGFNVADVNGSSGTLNITGGTLTVRGDAMYIGKSGNAVGTVNQSSGHVELLTGGETRIGGSGGFGDSGATGIYNISGDAILHVGNNLQIGAYGNGQFNQTGGTATVDGWTAVGRFLGGIGVLNVSAGSFTHTGTGTHLIIGELGNGTLGISGTGSVTVNSALWIGLSNSNGTGTGTVNLDGGTLSAPGIESPGAPSSSSTFNFNGGTLRATADNAAFMQGLTWASVLSGGAVIDTNGHNIAIGQALMDAGGGGGLTKNGQGTLTLSGGNSYTGVTKVNAGTLRVAGPGASVLGDVELVAGTMLLGDGMIGGAVRTGGGTVAPGGIGTPATLTVGSLDASGGGSIAFDLPTAPDGSGDFLQISGNLDLRGGGSLLINLLGSSLASGQYHLMHYDGSFAGGTLTPAGGGQVRLTLSLNTATAHEVYLNVSGSAADLVWSGTSDQWDVVKTAAWKNGANADKFYNFDQVVFDDSGAANPIVTIAENVQPAAIAVASSVDYTFAGPGVIGNGASLFKSGTGTLTIQGNHTFTGSVNISGGAISVAALANGGVASPIGASSADAANLTFDGGTLVYTGATTVTNRGMTINGGGGTLSVTDAGADITFGGTIVGFGQLTKTGPGSITLPTANAGFSGNVLIDQGTIYARDSASLGSSSIVVGDGGRLYLVGNLTPTNSSLSLNGDGAGSAALQIGGAATVNFAGSVDLTTDATISVDGGSTLNLTGPVSGSTLTKAGPGLLVLGASNGYAGTVLAGGTLSIGGEENIGGATSAVTFSGGLLRVTGTAITNLDSHMVNWSSFDGGVDVADPGNTFTVSQTLGGTGSFTKAGPGTLVLTGANTYSGATNVNGGTLVFSNLGNLGTGTAVTFANGGILKYDAGNTADITTRTVTLNEGGGGIDTNGNNVTFGGPIAAADGVVFAPFAKQGEGTLTYTYGGEYVIAKGNNNPTYRVQNGNVVFDGGPNAIANLPNGELTIGDENPNAVNVTIKSGTLNVGTWLSIGRGNGTTGLASSLVMTGGKLTAAQASMGYWAGVQGYSANPEISLSGDASLTLTNQMFVAESVGATATINLTDTASLQLGSFMDMGLNGNANLNISGQASLKVGSYITVGTFGQAVGVVTQSGGSVDIGAGGETRIGGAGGTGDSSAQGTYTISDGTLHVAGNFQVGAYGTGTLNQSGGVVTSDGWTAVGRFPGGVGFANITGGTFTQTSADRQLIIGEQGTGTMSISGTAVVTSVGGVRMTMNYGGSPGTATLNLDGGTLATPLVTSQGGTSTFNFNGGVLKATADNATFMEGLTEANVMDGGAVIDTNGHSITINQQLLGTGAGGLTKQGDGTLTVTAANSYKGLTRVKAGTLALATTQNLNDVTVDAQGTLRVQALQNIKTLKVDGGKVNVDAGRTNTLVLSALQILNNGAVDLTDNNVVIPYTGASPEAQIQALVKEGLDSKNTHGLFTSVGNDHDFSQSGRVLAVFDNHDAHFTQFGGLTLSNDWNQVLVKYTYLGDANADGKVDPTDYAVVDGLQGLGHSWITGDLNFDGKTTPDDYAQIDGNQGAGYGGAGGPALSNLGPPAPLAAVAVVPEPATLSVIALGGLALLGRRRRKA